MSTTVTLIRVWQPKGSVMIGEGVDENGETVTFTGANQPMSLLACLLAVGNTPQVNVLPEHILDRKAT